MKTYIRALLVLVCFVVVLGVELWIVVLIKADTLAKMTTPTPFIDITTTAGVLPQARSNYLTPTSTPFTNLICASVYGYLKQVPDNRLDLISQIERNLSGSRIATWPVKVMSVAPSSTSESPLAVELFTRATVLDPSSFVGCEVDTITGDGQALKLNPGDNITISGYITAVMWQEPPDLPQKIVFLTLGQAVFNSK